MDNRTLQVQIYRMENETERLQKELVEAKDVYDIICECEQKSRICNDNFHQSIELRRKKLEDYTYLTSVSKFARGYNAHMHQLLTGGDYSVAFERANQIKETLSLKKEEMENEIESLKARIREKEQQIQRLRSAVNSGEG